MIGKIKIIKIFIIFFINIITFYDLALATKGIYFKAEEITSLKEKDLIIGKGNANVEIKDEIKISAEEFTYEKLNEIVTAKNKVEVYDYKNKIYILSDNIIYDNKKNNIISYGETTINTKNGHKITTRDIEYNIKNKFIISKYSTVIIDNEKNIIKTSSIYFD